MTRKLSRAALAAFALSVGVLSAGGVSAQSEHAAQIEDFAFSFEGPFGSFDRNQLQRGLQIYTEVCAGCHGMKLVPIRSLADSGGPQLPEDQVKAYAQAFTVIDEASNPQLFDQDKGEYRALGPADQFPANKSIGAPDLSVMAKARAGFHGPYGLGISQFLNGMGGPEYIASLLTGYTGEEKTEFGANFYENKAFSTGWIKMTPPLSDGQVTFADNSPNDVVHMSQDVAAFLMWAAEPKLMARKEAGFIGVTFLMILAVLLYMTNKRIWAPIKGRKPNPAE